MRTSARQGECLIQGKEAGRTRTGVAHAHHLHGTEHRGEGACAQAAMSIAEPFVAGLDQQRGADIAVTTLLEMCLQQEA